MKTTRAPEENRVAQEPNWNRKLEPSEPFFLKPKAEPEPPEPFTRNQSRNRPSLLNCTEKQTNHFCRGTARTENRNRWNRSTPQTVTEWNRGLPEKSSKSHNGCCCQQ